MVEPYCDKSGNEWKVYINGSYGTVSLTMNASQLFDNTHEIIWGKGMEKTNINGFLDELAIWDTALSSSQVSDLYNSGASLSAANVQSSNLKLYYDLEGSDLETILDQSGMVIMAEVIQHFQAIYQLLVIIKLL